MEILRTSSRMTLLDYWTHIRARIGIRRNSIRVEPGLYALGNPTADSPVFVTANYTLSFDALRSNLSGKDAYILVLDTKGINVWCAAGKGTFGTDELIRKIESTHLNEVVCHRNLIVPQLGAPGVAAHAVTKDTKFKIQYGPIKASDIPEYLKSGSVSQKMRKVSFRLSDRLLLIPVEVTSILILACIYWAVRWILRGRLSLGLPDVSLAVLAGIVLFPILLPWLPTRDFSTKGFFLGFLVALPFVTKMLVSPNPGSSTLHLALDVSSKILIWSSLTAYFSLQFTGSTTFTSRSGVRREIFRYIPIMAGMFVVGIIFALI